ncbi:thiol peroxidase Prx-SUH [Malaciobacter mytili]|uniref:Thiol peroxidase n=1 Tax=Malaciobacter mytili LMG 24559 TaxID=1032238 RepID=A0AAX2AHB5_9BACT|nr:thiol peroxidase [Malaciobacter mytili]AXH14245.1 lipid hydroperoxide peroxidase [Malaciobacter mytili LMG 24559]RXI48778.1 lipid hydroperoxide peroxidase [Malaciobacter mytili]RXK15313.1 lipid hydroperoxide peroxidase [Malaciobacter mytili LMG 24559]
MAITHLKGNVVNLEGNEVNVSDLAPVVKIVGQDLSEIEVGGEKGCAQILVVVPSLDTPVCAAETRKFNEEAAKLENAQITVVSMDLPFAMGRFCTTEGIENLKVGSDFRNKELSKAYGVLIADGPLAGISCRAIFVINASGVVTYKEICNEITEEPNYDAALQAAKEATSTSCCGSCH